MTVNSLTSLTANISINTSADLGARTVTVTTGAQVVSLANGFTVVLPGQRVPFSCAVTAGVPPLLRSEGFTELTGDLLIVCTGGSAGQSNRVNLQLFSNAPITSRLIGGQTEALLLVDELIGNPTSTPAVYRSVPGQNDNSIVWADVLVVAPGPTGQRTFRITNVRVNASAVAQSNTPVPSQVFAFVSASPSQSLPLRTPQHVVGFIHKGLDFDVTNCAGTGSVTNAFVQCASENASGNRNLISGTNGAINFGVRFTEGFQTSFKPQIVASQLPSTPGVVYHSESGFLRNDLPFAVGGADTGTRLAARFTNVPAGVRLFVTTRPTAGTSSGIVAGLVQNNIGAATATLFCPQTANDGYAAAEIPVVDGTATAVWEITAANPADLESVIFGVAVAYTANTPNGLPGLGLASVAGSFAPFYPPASAAGQMSATLPIPRFIETPIKTTAFRIDPCVTNILFPFVTNDSGFDTGIAISNTSVDPFGVAARPQAGACTINYYGRTPGGIAPPPQRSTVVQAGTAMTFVLSSGGSHNVPATPGFQGYIIAQCDFRYGHGFAFITDGPIGTSRVAEGYIGLVMDAPVPTRGTVSESLNH